METWRIHVAEYVMLYQKKETIKMQVRVKENTDEVGKCGCGRSPTGKCCGWHGLTEEQFQERLEKYQTGQQDLGGKDI
jgi:hypothetical protein